jgi:4-amino-4-deoxy-L-arabinose transferase-like glycosyltransferase
LGLLLLLAVFGFYAYLAMPLTGGFAALLLATLPGFFIYCRSSMSEISASALVVFAFMFAYLGLKEERRWKIYVSAAFLGLSLNIRMQSLFFAPLLLVMAFFPERGTRLRWLLHCAALPILFLLAASPGLALNTMEFHSPFKTGYDFWVPWTPNKWSEHRFSLRYLPNNVARLWSEFALHRSGFSAANVFGTGTCFVPAFVLLICVGLLFIRKGQFTFCALLSGLSFLAAALVYSVADIRLYLPLLLLIIAVAALPVTWAAENLFTGKRIVVVLVVFALFFGACVGFPSRSGYNTSGIDRSQAWDALQFATPPAESTWFIAQRRLLEVFGRQPAIVLSDIDPVYLNAFFPDWIVAAPLDWKHRYIFSRIWHYGPAEALALVNRGLQESHAVYALFVSRRDMEEKMVRLPHVDGYEWVLAEDSTAEAAILKLSPSR